MVKDSGQAEEIRLMLAVAGGDRDAFSIVYERSYRKVVRYVKGFVRDDSLGEDVIVQTFTVVWQQAASFRGSSRLTTWIIGIARNIALKEFRKIKPAVVFDEAYCAADTWSCRRVEESDRNAKTRKAITELSAKQQEVLELVFFQGMTYPEISEIVGIPVNTVKTRVFHAKKALKSQLETLDITRNDI